jgi:L,D-transpeptidase-like protein
MRDASGETVPAFFADQHPTLAGQTLSTSSVPELHGIVDFGCNTDLRWSDFTPYKTEVAKLYEANGYSLLWVQNGRVRPQGLAVIALLQNADAKGLDPEDYDGSRWRSRLLKLGQNNLDQKQSEQDFASPAWNSDVGATGCGTVPASGRRGVLSQLGFRARRRRAGAPLVVAA